MDTDLEDVWYSWLGSSYQSIRSLQSTPKAEHSDDKGKKKVSRVEERINNLTESLSETQAALEKAGEAERVAREQHLGCASALAKQDKEISQLQGEIKRLYEDVEQGRSMRDGQSMVHERLKQRIHELVSKIKRAEKEADETRYNMDHERLIHLQEREALRVVHAAHEECLASLRKAQETLAAYQEDVALRDDIIQNLKRHKSRISSKLSYFSTSLRRTSKELEDTKKRLSEVSEQLIQAEQIIQQHFSMLSALEAYKHQLAEELGHLRSNYEDRTLQLVRMRGVLLERNDVIAVLRDKLEEKDDLLRHTEARAVSTQQELADIMAELLVSKNATASAERDIHEITDFHTKLNGEKDREIAELDRERGDLRNTLKTTQQENGVLRSDLAAAQADASAKEQRLAEEIAAHARTSDAAAAQKLRLQNSIENLRSNLEKANGDLKKTRETLFALNEKCHDFAKAQLSLANYQKKTKHLLGNGQTHQRHDSGTFIVNKPHHEHLDFQASQGEPQQSEEDILRDAEGQQVSEEHAAAVAKAKVQEDILNRLQQSIQNQVVTMEPRGPDSIFEPLTTQGTAPKFLPRLSPPTPPQARGNQPVEPTSALSSSSLDDSPATPDFPITSPKRVRFALADEGYQTDEDNAATSENQMWGIIGNLEKAKKSSRTVKRQRRQLNLKVASPALPSPLSSP